MDLQTVILLYSGSLFTLAAVGLALFVCLWVWLWGALRVWRS